MQPTTKIKGRGKRDWYRVVKEEVSGRLNEMLKKEKKKKGGGRRIFVLRSTERIVPDRKVFVLILWGRVSTRRRVDKFRFCRKTEGGVVMDAGKQASKQE